MKLRIGALAILASLACAPAQAQVMSGGWEVEFDGRGTCLMATEYDAGSGFKAAVAIGISSDSLILSFVSERWNMKAGNVFKVNMTIDRSWEQAVKVKAEDNQTLVILFDYSPDLLDTIARGNKIVLDDGRESWSFTLHGTQKAVPTLLQCARRHVW